MMYDREHAPGELKLRFHIRNKRGEDILNTLRYDPDTGQGFKRDIYGHEIEFFEGSGYVDIDGHTNPIKEELDAIYASVRAHLSPAVRESVIRKVIEDARANANKEPDAAT
jgi:hypothetical protein